MVLARHQPTSFEPLDTLVAGLPNPAPSAVRLHQRGEMRLKPHGRWLPWTGTEDMVVGRVAFVWRARFALPLGARLDVEDAYDADGGRLTGKLWGRLPLFDKRGPGFDGPEAMRYLAELPWVPFAFADNGEVELERVSERVLRASTRVGPERVAVDLTFDERGRITESFAPSRRHESGQCYPWRGRFWDHEEVNGVCVPRRGAVAWERPEGSFVYWRGEVLSVDLLAGGPTLAGRYAL